MSSSSAETKVALVTGSSSGIGEATVKLLSQRGYKVVVVGSKQEKVDRVVKECAALSPEKFQPLGLVLDFSNPENGELAVKKTIEHFKRLDVLVNNAGIFVKTNSNDPDSYKTYRNVMDINLESTVKATLASVEHIKKVDGNIIMVSSVASVRATDYCYAYAMSKAAMSQFARSLAIDLSPNVRVNIVSPGPVSTPIFGRVGLSPDQAEKVLGVTTLQNRIGDTEEIAKTIAFLISDEAKFINGHELFIDGGYLLKPSNFNVSQVVIAKKAVEDAGK